MTGSMRCVVNGEAQELPDAASVAELLRLRGLEKSACAVEVNASLVPKREHAGLALAEGDRVEIVTLVGGG